MVMMMMSGYTKQTPHLSHKYSAEKKQNSDNNNRSIGLETYASGKYVL
jgi:hypothetical protein